MAALSEMASFSPGRCHPFAAFPKGDGSLEGDQPFPVITVLLLLLMMMMMMMMVVVVVVVMMMMVIIVLKYTKLYEIILCMFIIGLLYSY